MKIFLIITAFVLLIGLLRIGELYTQLARYKVYWNRHNQQTLAHPKTNSIRYYALGDSAAQGIGASSPKKGYTNLVANYLSDTSARPIEFINLSKSGATVEDALNEQIPILKSLGVGNDAVVTVEIGANDMAEFDPKKFEQSMDKFMSELPKQTIISDIPSFAGGRFSEREKSVLEANEIVVRLSDKYGLKRAALYDKVASNHGLLTVGADFFHPSNKGYRENWAPAFIERLKN